MIHIKGPATWTTGGIIRWAATGISGVCLAIFIEENLRHLIEEHHWNEVLTSAGSTLPQFSKLWVAWWFWFLFGISLGAAGTLWILRLFPGSRRSSLIVEFDEGIPGCRVETQFQGQRAIFYRAKVTNFRRRPVAVTANLIGIKKKNMNGEFTSTTYVDSLPLVWSLEGSDHEVAGQLATEIPKYLDILFTTENNSIHMATKNVLWPNSAKGLFDSPGVFLLEIAFSGPGIKERLMLLLQWTGDWRTTTLARPKAIEIS